MPSIETRFTYNDKVYTEVDNIFRRGTIDSVEITGNIAVTNKSLGILKL